MQHHRKIKAGLWTLMCFLGASPAALALQQEFTFQHSNPKLEALKSEKIKVLSLVKSEWSIKGDLIRKRIEDPDLAGKSKDKPDTFKKLKDHAYEFNPLSQSWIYEVDELFKEKGSKLKSKNLINQKNLYKVAMEGSQIDLAKKIAKKELYYKVIENWSCRNKRPNKEGQVLCLSQTVFNRDGISDDADHTRETLAFIVDSFNQSFFYVPNETNVSKDYFLFKMPDLGYVEIDKKTLKKGRVVFQIGNDIDNKLPPEALNIKADNDPSFNNDSDKPYNPKPSSGNSSSKVSVPESTPPINSPQSAPNTTQAPSSTGYNSFDDDTDF